MSNTDGKKEGLRPCPYDNSTNRDSNGQCHCRNVLYRLSQKVNKADRPKVAKVYNDTLEANKDTLKPVENIETALTAVRAKFPALKPKVALKAPAKKAAAPKRGPKVIADKLAKAGLDLVDVTPEPSTIAKDLSALEDQAAAVVHGPKDVGDKFECLCGFQGKGTLPSIKSHVAVALKRQKTNA